MSASVQLRDDLFDLVLVGRRVVVDELVNQPFTVLHLLPERVHDVEQLVDLGLTAALEEAAEHVADPGKGALDLGDALLEVGEEVADRFRLDGVPVLVPRVAGRPHGDVDGLVAKQAHGVDLGHRSLADALERVAVHAKRRLDLSRRVDADEELLARLRVGDIAQHRVSDGGELHVADRARRGPLDDRDVDGLPEGRAPLIGPYEEHLRAEPTVALPLGRLGDGGHAHRRGVVEAELLFLQRQPPALDGPRAADEVKVGGHAAVAIAAHVDAAGDHGGRLGDDAREVDAGDDANIDTREPYGRAHLEAGDVGEERLEEHGPFEEVTLLTDHEHHEHQRRHPEGNEDADLDVGAAGLVVLHRPTPPKLYQCWLPRRVDDADMTCRMYPCVPGGRTANGFSHRSSLAHAPRAAPGAALGRPCVTCARGGRRGRGRPA